jgi:hypothetical protein
MPSNWRISRRTALRGLGASVSLPYLNAMGGESSRADARSVPPVRMGFFYIPNGVRMDHWRPESDQDLNNLPKILKPLESVKDQVTVISNLEADHCTGEGAGHEPAGGSFLVGKKCKHSEAPESGGTSVDQVYAREAGLQTPVESLCLGIDPAHRGDHGYSGTYLSHMSWRSKKVPSSIEFNPKFVFQRLFSGQQPRRNSAKEGGDSSLDHSIEASVLDLVREEARSLQRRVGFDDRRKLDQYLEGIRSVEKRIARASTSPSSHHKDAFTDETDPHDPEGFSKLIKVDVPDGRGIPESYAEHVQLMTDLMVLGFQTDSTRVSTFMFSFEKSNRSYDEIDAKGAHHSLSHHEDKEKNLDCLTKINTFHMQLFARMLESMREIKEGERTLLDNTILLYGSGISDGNKHNHDDLPVLIAGGAGAALKGNRHLKLAEKTPICNLYLSMLDHVGISKDQFGDSTGRLDLS